MRKNSISIFVYGRSVHQGFYEIPDELSLRISECISNNANADAIDSIESDLTYVDTVNFFDTANTLITIHSNGRLFGEEAYSLSESGNINHTYAIVDSSSYSDPVPINSSSSKTTSNPERWVTDTQKMYDLTQTTQYMSAINSLLLKGAESNVIKDKDYLIKTSTSLSLYQYKFKLPDAFNLNKLDVIIDPADNYFLFSAKMIPDFVLYDEVLCCGKKMYSIPLTWEWAKGCVKATGQVSKCDNFTAVSF